MTLEEIFKEDGLYVGQDFAEGVCFKVRNGFLYMISYENVDDIFPTEENLALNKNMFRDDYKKVFTRQSLFKNNSK